MNQEDILQVRFAGAVGQSPGKHMITREQAACELDARLWKATLTLREMGVNVIGALVQQNEKGAADQEREELNIQIIPTGQVINIFLPEKCARIGCRLNREAFQTVVDAVYSLTAQLPDNGKAVIFLNRFGKEEAEGGGYHKIFELALDKNIPVIVGVGNNSSSKKGHDFREAWGKYIEGTTGVYLESYSEIIEWCARNDIIPHTSSPSQINHPQPG